METAGTTTSPIPDAASAQREEPRRTSPIVSYLASLTMVGAAGVVAFVVEHIVQASNLSLVFVLPVVIAAAAFGWGPSLTAAVAGVAVFDFFFIEPRFTFVVASPTDLWAMALLLLVAGIVSAVATESRRRALEARRAADAAEALHSLARVIINSGPPAALLRAAAGALSRMFDAPTIILQDAGGQLATVAADAGASLSAGDEEAAAWVAANGKPTRAQTYPFDVSEYDFWPAVTAAGRRLVLGVKFRSRPAEAERQVELVSGYLGESSV